MEIHDILREAGLAGNEVKVYLALLDIGPATAGEITKRSGINRTNVYDALARLSEKGLASFVKKAQRRHFEAASPYRMLRNLEEREAAVRRARDLVEGIAPELEMRRKLDSKEHEAAVYTGKKGLRTVAEDVIMEGSELLVFGAEGEFARLFRNYYRNWNRRRAAARMHMKVVYSDRLRKEKSPRLDPFAEMRFSSSLYDVPATTWVYGDSIAVIVWSGHPVITLIRNAKVASGYRKFFRELWRSSRGPSL